MSQASRIAIDLLERVKAAGGKAWVDGEMVRLEASEPLPDDLRAELRAHKAEVIAALSAQSLDESEITHRVRAFREQIKRQPRWRPFVCLPGVKSKPGHCLSCGEELPQGHEIRCHLCITAARVVLDYTSAPIVRETQ